MEAFWLQARFQHREITSKMGVHRFGELRDIQSHPLAGTARYLPGGMHTAIGAPREMNWDGLAGNLLERSFQFTLNGPSVALTL